MPSPCQPGCPHSWATVPLRMAPSVHIKAPQPPPPQQKHLRTGVKVETRKQREPCDESPLYAHLLCSLRSPERPSNLPKVEQP